MVPFLARFFFFFLLRRLILCRFSGSVLLIVDEEALVLCDQNTLLPAAFDIDYLII